LSLGEEMEEMIVLTYLKKYIYIMNYLIDITRRVQTEKSTCTGRLEESGKLN